MNYQQVLQKFFKGMLFGAGSAVFSVDLSGFTLTSVDAYHKLLIVVVAALCAGALHGLWDAGKQYFFPVAPTV
jgi:hypothetical protein